MRHTLREHVPVEQIDVAELRHAESITKRSYNTFQFRGRAARPVSWEAAAMDVYEALYTTRAMRRCRPDPIPDDVQQRILDAAIRAPSGGNTQNWRFMLVDDPGLRGRLGPIYRDCLSMLWATVYKERIDTASAAPDEPENAQMLRVQRSAQHLADHFEEYPLLLFSFVQYDPTGGSIYPSTWSAMLAARAEGVGASLTSVFVFQLDDVLAILDVPKAGRLAVLVVRDVRLPDRPLGCRTSTPGPRSVVSQRLGQARRFRDQRAALEGIATGGARRTRRAARRRPPWPPLRRSARRCR